MQSTHSEFIHAFNKIFFFKRDIEKLKTKGCDETIQMEIALETCLKALYEGFYQQPLDMQKKTSAQKKRQYCQLGSGHE